MDIQGGRSALAISVGGCDAVLWFGLKDERRWAAGSSL